MTQARPEHEISRPAVGTSQAASMLGVTRQAVAQALRDGRLEGYGVPSGGRTRWFVYVDSIAARSAQTPGRSAATSEIGQLKRENSQLRDELVHLLRVIDELRAAYSTQAQFVDQLMVTLQGLAAPSDNESPARMGHVPRRGV